MQIVIMASGTRGDVQPMLALGIALRRAGHTVRLIAGANFAAWIAAHDLEAYATVDMEALMQSDLGLAWAEGTSQRAQLQTMKRLMQRTSERTIHDTIQGTEGADLLISGFVTEPFAQAISERRRIPQISVALQPYRPTRSGAASIVALLPHTNSVLNRWMGGIAQRLTWSVVQETIGTLRATLDLPAQTAAAYQRAAQTIPALYAMSAHVVPPVDDANAYTTGYWFLDDTSAPSPDVQRFIEAGPPPIYIGFGSMTSSDPARLTQTIVEALARTGQRGVLVRGWSGAAKLDLPDFVYPLDSVSHRWLFPRMAALVHHGGAGTTAAGLAAGKPSLIVPHLGDQRYWGRRVYELGVGVRPLLRPQITAATLAQRLEQLLADTRISTNAAALGARIQAEHGVTNAIDWISRFVAA